MIEEEGKQRTQENKMATMTKTPKLTHVEDHEGMGVCGACDRSGLRWIACFDNGSQIGMECAKKVLGYRPAAKSYNWVPDYEIAAEKIICGETFLMWKHKANGHTIETRNGEPMVWGGVEARWKSLGWL